MFLKDIECLGFIEGQVHSPEELLVRGEGFTVIREEGLELRVLRCDILVEVLYLESGWI